MPSCVRTCADAFPACETAVSPVVAGTSTDVTCRLNYTRFTDLSPGAAVTSSVTWPDGDAGYFRSEASEGHRTGPAAFYRHLFCY